MALIGNWGDFTFYVSADQIKTFDSLKWDSAAKYSTHDRHLREPLLEYTGTDVETITFTMFFSVFLGVNPIKEIASLLQAMRRGEVNRLVIGPGKWKNLFPERHLGIAMSWPGFLMMMRF